IELSTDAYGEKQRPVKEVAGQRKLTLLQVSFSQDTRMRTVNLQGVFQGLYLDLRLELSLYLIRVSEHRLAIGVNEFHQIASSDSSYTKRIFSHFEGLGSS